MITKPKFHVVLINGPAGSGKDYAAGVLTDAWHGRGWKVWHEGFAHALKAMTHDLYAVPTWAADAIAMDRGLKDEPNGHFLGLTPRQAYIAVSETYLKPKHGDDVLARMWLSRLPEPTTEPGPDALPGLDFGEGTLYVAPDAGFRSECDYVIDEVGPTNVTYVNLHREWYTFAGDSRSRVYTAETCPRGVTYREVDNPGNRTFAAALLDALSHLRP